MCVSPTFIYVEAGPSFERLETPCGWCWSCQQNRLNDLVGRCLVEASTSDWTLAITLTYDDKRITDPLQTKVIQKKDFQAFMKRLRHSVETRYLVAGEYGARKGRTHFHAILFGKGKPPTWELNSKKPVDIPEWPYGHVWIDPSVSERTLRYTAKYLLKGTKRKKSRHDHRFNKEWLSYSRIPIMGHDFVLDLAARYAAEKMWPHSFKYRPPLAHQGREYQLVGEARYIFLDAFFSLWPEAENMPMPESMARPYLRFVKQRQERAFNALSSAQRQKLLEIEPRVVQRPNQRDMRLYGAFLRQQMERCNCGTIKEFAKVEPDLYGQICFVFRRNLVAQPPTRSETGYDFSP